MVLEFNGSAHWEKVINVCFPLLICLRSEGTLDGQKASRTIDVESCEAYLRLAGSEILVIVEMEMHEKREIRPQVVMPLLVPVEVQAQMLKLIAALATDETCSRYSA